MAPIHCTNLEWEIPMENHNDCVNASTVVNYYYRLGFPCTEALCISSTHFRPITVPQKSFSKESPIFKPADTFLISFKYKQKEGFLSEEWTVVLGVMYKSPHPVFTSCLAIHH